MVTKLLRETPETGRRLSPNDHASPAGPRRVPRTYPAASRPATTVTDSRCAAGSPRDSPLPDTEIEGLSEVEDHGRHVDLTRSGREIEGAIRRENKALQDY